MRIRRSPGVLTLAAVVAIVLLAGTTLAVQSGLSDSSRAALGAPESSEAAEAPEGSEAPPSADELARIVDRLKAAGITASASELSDLAAKVGVGGAVRAFAFAHASGKTPAEIVAMFEAGKGWGQIRKDLNLSIGPGIGWIMGHGGEGGDGDDSGPESSDDPGE